MIDGNAIYEADGQSYVASAGSVVLCQAGVNDAFFWDPCKVTRHGYVHFNIEAAPRHWPARANWPVVRQVSEGNIIVPMFRYLLTWIGQGDAGQTRLTVAHILTAFVTGEAAISNRATVSYSPPVERALEMTYSRLDTNLADPLSLADLAGAAFVTSEHLCRLFQSELGVSPSEVVRMERLDRASGLVCGSNFSMTDIASMCGFYDAFHFSRRFKEAFGKSPTELRRDVRAGASPPKRLLDRLWP